MTLPPTPSYSPLAPAAAPCLRPLARGDGVGGDSDAPPGLATLEPTSSTLTRV